MRNSEKCEMCEIIMWDSVQQTIPNIKPQFKIKKNFAQRIHLIALYEAMVLYVALA